MERSAYEATDEAADLEEIAKSLERVQTDLAKMHLEKAFADTLAEMTPAQILELADRHKRWKAWR